MKKKCRLGFTNTFVNSMTKEDVKRIVKFFSEIKKINGVLVDEEKLEFTYDDSQEKEINSISEKYLLKIK